MRATPEFLKFTAQFHQDIMDIHGSTEEAIETALESLSKPEREALRSFLAGVIAADASNDQLFELWNSARADFYLSEPSQARGFFRLLLSRISS